MKPLLFGFFVVIFFSRCSDDTMEAAAPVDEDTLPDKKLVEFVIPKGQHYAVREDSIVWLNITALNFDVIFDSSAIYKTNNIANQGDINKLYGFADNDHHQTNSARLGWRWYNNQLQLHAYVYKFKKRSSKFLKAIPFNQPVSCSIAIKGGTYIFVADEDTVALSRGPQQATAAGYKLFPYFGGDETAPHDIKIKIKEI